MKQIPEIGKKYNCFDDGKVSQSRMYQVLITDVIKFEEVDTALKNIIELVQNNYDWLYPNTTDYVVCGVSYELENFPKMCYFIRTNDGGWFGIGELDCDGMINSLFCSGRLDVDNSLTEQLKEIN